MKYLIIFEKTKTGYSAFSPDLLDCVAIGTTKEEVEKKMREAILIHIDSMHQEGLEIPQCNSFAKYLEVNI